MTDKDKRRLFREFYYPPRISASGNYYPRYKVQGDSQTGTSHVSFIKTLLQLPGSQLLSWLFQVCL